MVNDLQAFFVLCCHMWHEPVSHHVDSTKQNSTSRKYDGMMHDGCGVMQSYKKLTDVLGESNTFLNMLIFTLKA